MNGASFHPTSKSALAGIAIFASVVLIGCNGPRAINESPIIVTGNRVYDSAAEIEEARERESIVRMERQSAHDSVIAAATIGCSLAICDAVGRGEIVMGMNEAQVMAATHSVPNAWSIRSSGSMQIMSPISSEFSLSDREGKIALIQLENGRVSSVARQGRTGLIVENSLSSSDRSERVRVIASALIVEGDDYAAAGDKERALERYDRALVLTPDDAMLNYRVAQLLDQQLRPVEALMRYQRFLLSMELQKIEAQGTQYAKMAEAIAIAQQRVIVLDRRQW